jgi:hypothetical protein
MAEQWTSKDDALVSREYETYTVPVEDSGAGSYVAITRDDWDAVMAANAQLWKENQEAITVIEKLRELVEARTATCTLLVFFLICIAGAWIAAKVIG